MELSDGVVSILEVDPFSDDIVNLYLPKRFWEYLVRKFNGNKMTVVLRGSFEAPSTAVVALRGNVSEKFFKKED